jgi:23S rRNA (uracil1939-C5)-methyltransferase
VPSAPIATGQPWLEEELLGRRFRVSANAFFQVNTEQAEVLARLVLERLAPALGESILDAYCGVGTFALLAADRVGGRGRVVAIEEAGQAIADARVNAAGVSCVEIVQGRVERVVPRLDATFDGAVLDPARAGCERIVLDALIARPPRRIVYVSCDPATLARDLRILVDGGYRLVEVVPVDMFPQTFHIECVATLER